jgi:hypothetical protein
LQLPRHHGGCAIYQFTKYNSGGNANMTDVLILAGPHKRHVYTPHFTYHGLRYVEVRGLPDPTSANADTLICHM